MAAGSRASRSHRIVAILFVTRSRPGPRLVFHYPPNPRPSFLHPRTRKYDPSDLSDVTSDSDAESGEATEHDTINSNAVSPDTVLGLSEDSLEKLLSPGCWCDRKKFEVSLDGLSYLSHPIYAAYDSSWDRKHTHGPITAQADSKIPQRPKATRSETDENHDGRTQLGITVTAPQTPARAVHDFTHVPESLDSQGGLSMATSMNSSSTVSAVASDRLAMFNVVFVLAESSPKLYQQEASDVYQHVAKKLGKALHYCQMQTGYVGTESRKLLALKAKAKQEGLSTETLWSRMLQSSELAWALKEVYERISIGEIAGIRLDGSEMSLQCPPSDDPNETRSDSKLEPHSGLLLLEDKDVLLRGLGHFDASPLAYFIRELTPTKSLQKHVVKLGMPIDNILWLARHLIKWRKARVISPLNARNVYSVSPDAPLDRLADHLLKYALRFSALPTLPQMLKVLSGKPIRYGMLIPSRDHRAPYMEILAFLLQYQFVQQLRTFGWLQVVSGLEKTKLDTYDNRNRRPLSVVSLLSPQLRPIEDDIVSVSSERTAIPVSAADEAPSGSITDEKGKLMIITDPLNPAAKQTEYIEQICHSIDDDDLRYRLPSLLRYFDGEQALEGIAAHEGLKRSKVDAWLETLHTCGFLSTFRHL